MTDGELRRLRLLNQQVTCTNCKTPQDVVAHLGAMQAQEYRMAKWAVGLRLPAAAERDVEAACNAGHILRTHLLRPTWHFVTPADIRWLLALSAPQVHAKNRPYYRKFELDEATLAACCRTLECALAGAGALTRAQLAEALGKSGIAAAGHRLSYIMMYAELSGLVCSGPRAGRQFTYRLLDDVAPPLHGFVRDEALARLAARYFAARGPAGVRDFAYWAGLSLRDAARGAEQLGAAFDCVVIGGQSHYYSTAGHAEHAGACKNGNEMFLLPDYDEYGMGYKDRTFLAAQCPPTQEPSPYSHWLVLRGRIAGTWAEDKGGVTATPFAPFAEKDRTATGRAVARYLQYMDNTGG